MRVLAAILFFSWTVSALDQSLRLLPAWDCSQPQAKEAVQTKGGYQDCASPKRAVHQEEADYLLMQKADYVRITGQRCVVTETTIPLYCGNYDHQTLITPLVKLAEDIPIKADDCKEMWRTNKWTDSRKREHQLEVNKTVEVFYESVGTTTPSAAHVDCVGGQYRANGRLYDEVVVAHYRKILLQQVELSIGQDGVVLVVGSQTRLPCSERQEQCRSTSGTYTWKNPSIRDRCYLYQTRRTTGIEVKDEDGTTTYMSRDKSMIRLVIHQPTSQCGQLVYKTNYEKLMVTKAYNEPLFQRKLGLSEFSTVTYFNQQDGFLHGELTQYIQTELRAVLRQECEKDEVRRDRAYARLAAEQRAISDGETTYLGDGWFTTAAGESWYRYKCRNITVVARDDEHCYSALPVDLWHEDKLNYFQQRGETNETTMEAARFFIEPHSHRLTTIGIRSPCVGPFAPLYRAKEGHWIRVNPSISLAGDPKQLTDPKLIGREVGQPRVFDWEKGGIYHKEEVLSMETMRQNPRVIVDLTTSLTRQAQDHGWKGNSADPITIRELIPDKWSILEPILAFLERWGRIASTIISLCFLFKIISWLTGLILRILAGPVDARMGPCIHIMTCFFPAAGPFIERRFFGPKSNPTWTRLLGKRKPRKNKRDPQGPTSPRLPESDDQSNHDDDNDQTSILRNRNYHLQPYNQLQNSVQAEQLRQNLQDTVELEERAYLAQEQANLPAGGP